MRKLQNTTHFWGQALGFILKSNNQKESLKIRRKTRVGFVILARADPQSGTAPAVSGSAAVRQHDKQPRRAGNGGKRQHLPAKLAPSPSSPQTEQPTEPTISFWLSNKFVIVTAGWNYAHPAAPHFGQPHYQRELGPGRQGRHGDDAQQASEPWRERTQSTFGMSFNQVKRWRCDNRF